MKKALYLILTCISLQTLAPALAGTKWVPADPPDHCDNVCDGQNLRAVDSSNPNVGRIPFYVCEAHVGSESRPGFNVDLSDEVNKLCIFELGGEGPSTSDYSCLCE